MPNEESEVVTNDLVLQPSGDNAVGEPQLQPQPYNVAAVPATYQDENSEHSSDSEASTVPISETSSVTSSDSSSSDDSSSESDSGSSEPCSGNKDDYDSDSFIGNVKVCNGIELTVNEGVLVLVDLFLENKLTKKTIGKIATSVQKFLPPNNYMPKSKHQLFKYVKDLCPPVPERTHYWLSV